MVLEQCDFIKAYAPLGTKSAVHLTLIAANGVVKNANMFDIQSVVTLDDLFYP